jgi:hypothetical protein
MDINRFKIGIFGDSFSSKPTPHAVEDSTFWCDIIGQHHDVENFSEPGTSLYWSYNLLRNNYKKFDVIIFVVTGFGRFYVPHAENETVQHAFSLSQIETLLSRVKTEFHNYSENDITILKTLRDYKIYAEDDNQSALFHVMLLDRIKKLVPNIILMPAWGGCLNPLKLLHGGGDTGYNSLLDISLLDVRYCGITFENIAFDRRYGHLSPHNNLMLGSDLLMYLQSDRKNPYTINLSLYGPPDHMSGKDVRNLFFELK